MRQIVIDGCDGTGKTNLVNDLMKELDLPVHPRSTPSVGGPPADLDDWVEREFKRDKPIGIYDRHAVISEPIYGPICRGTMPGLFNNRQWLREQRMKLAYSSIVVFCIPPWSDVWTNIRNGTHMDGVEANAYRIYQQYDFAHKTWPGPVVLHDYTLGPKRREFVINRIRTKYLEI